VKRYAYCCPWHALCEPEGTTKTCILYNSTCNADAQCAKDDICHRIDGEYNGECKDPWDVAATPTQDEVRDLRKCKDNHNIPEEQGACLKKHKNRYSSFDSGLDVEKTCEEIKNVWFIQGDWCLKARWPSYRNEQRAMMDCCAKTCGFCN